MKLKEFLKKFIVFASISALIMSAGFYAFAVDGEGENPDVIVETDAPVEEETDYVPETEAPTDAPVDDETDYVPETEAPTDAPVDDETDYVPETEAPTDEVIGNETEETYEEEEETYASVTEKLPRVEEEVQIPTAISSSNGEDGDLTYGYVSWACVIIGVLVVLVVLISNKSHYYGGEGKHRYGEGNRITGQQKRLLDEDYYKNRKYNSYYTKDIRK